MKIAINIPDKMYKRVLNGKNVKLRFGKYVTVKDVWVSELIRQGTPLPKGHWREVDVNKYACSKCSHVLTINPFDNSISEMNTCPFCSADMREVEDGND